MQVLKNVNHIPWKYVIGMNLTVLVLAVSFVSVTSVNKNTENRSQAEEVVSTPPPEYHFDSSKPPKLLNPDIDWGKVGDAIVIKGENLGTSPFGTLKIGNVFIPQSSIIAWESNQIVFIIPNGAVTAPITLLIPTNTEAIILTTGKSLTVTDKNQL
jgi:hypothetical protein